MSKHAFKMMRLGVTGKVLAEVDRNARLLAEQAQMRDEIMARRPHWDRAKLEAVTWTWGGGHHTEGLHDILEAIKKADALEQAFKGGA